LFFGACTEGVSRPNKGTALQDGCSAKPLLVAEALNITSDSHKNLAFPQHICKGFELKSLGNNSIYDLFS
jgi:hypothetical protein